MLPIWRLPPTQIVGAALVMSVFCLTVCDVEAGTIVVPPAFENVEANAHCCEGSAPRPGVRFQEIHLASEFAQMDPSPGVVVQLAYRPDKDVRGPRTPVWHDLELRLSTTDRGPGSMSSRFDANFGADVTVVYSGDLTMSTQAAGPSSGPRPFDYVIEFQRPFVYDPSEGNLVIDFRVSSIEGGPYIDGPRYYDGLNRAMIALSPSAARAAAMFDAHNAVELLVRDLALGDLNLDGELNGLDVEPFVDVLVAGEFHMAADMDCDGIVSGLDVAPFVATVLAGDTQPIPEPTTRLLVLVALALVSGRRIRGSAA